MIPDLSLLKQEIEQLRVRLLNAVENETAYPNPRILLDTERLLSRCLALIDVMTTTPLAEKIRLVVGSAAARTEFRRTATRVKDVANDSRLNMRPVATLDEAADALYSAAELQKQLGELAALLDAGTSGQDRRWSATYGELPEIVRDSTSTSIANRYTSRLRNCGKRANLPPTRQAR